MVWYDLRQAYVVGSTHSIHSLCYTSKVAPYWAGKYWGISEKAQVYDLKKLNTLTLSCPPPYPPGGELEMEAALLPQR